ncbi:hypothetical protein KM043_007930 [Ampulex compressa]|nr:hypothetical protein KM043_007930 [Ampulex compressa]
MTYKNVVQIAFELCEGVEGEARRNKPSSTAALRNVPTLSHLISQRYRVSGRESPVGTRWGRMENESVSFYPRELWLTVGNRRCRGKAGCYKRPTPRPGQPANWGGATAMESISVRSYWILFTG